MRALLLICLLTATAACIGCQGQNASREPEPPPPDRRGSLSMYPLSTPQTGGTLTGTGPQEAVYADQAYTGVVDMSQASTIAPMGNPPVLVDDAYYAGTPTVTTSYAPPSVQERPNRPMTFAERKLSQPSPYAPLFANPYATSYSGMQTTTMAPVVTTQYYEPQQVVATTVPVTTTTYAATTPVTEVTYAATPAVYQTTTTYPVATTATYRTGSYIVPIADPPEIVRDASGRIVSTKGVSSSTTLPLVRVPAMYAPGAVGTTTYTTTRYAPVNTPVTYTTTTTATTPAPIATALTPDTAVAAGGLRLVPAFDVPSSNRPNDIAPSQWFEIIRPGNGPLRIGRVSSTCVCVSVRVPKRFIEAGERALVEARIVSRPPANNLTYGMYVSVLEPVNVMLDTDVTINM